jgi:hypothetical protein
MAIDKAIIFVKRATTENGYRKECYKISKQDLMQNLGFDEFEFDDAVNMQLVKCQSHEQAEVFQQIRMWFSVL